MEIKLITCEQRLSVEEKKIVVDFLYENLEEYSDPKEDIEKAINHIYAETSPAGGFILLAYLHSDVVGVAVVLRTGMADYIPENILVYIAVDRKFRGLGIGKNLMRKMMDTAKGNIALHVDPQNPARFLYEKIGFETKYLEMRFIKKQ